MAFSFKNLLPRKLVDFFSGKVFKPAVKKTSPAADRLLVDAIRLAELPSPAAQEEPRAAFVLERLKNMGFVPSVNEAGDIMVRLHSRKSVEEAPILLFADIGSERWHPVESLARLDAASASGAGLCDSLGGAALLSIAENFEAALAKEINRDILLLFNLKAADEPGDGFKSILNDPKNRPFAAIGTRGFSLGKIIHSVGTYRVKIKVSGNNAAGAAEDRFPAGANRVTETLIDTARTLLGITWDAQEKTKMFIRRIEAQAVYAHTPQEGEIELEIESVDAAHLELAMNAVVATTNKIGEKAALAAETALLSYIPPGDPQAGAPLFETLRKLFKDERLKVQEESGCDPAAFFTAEGIPALSLGIALGREGKEKDVVSIDSLEKGSLVLQRLIKEIGKQNGA
ncbi:MAG: hypothetical protein FWG66_09660 [Spirochaetes bacterium]|nr:hypothetical protein [Spirochaetota bacterium]